MKKETLKKIEKIAAILIGIWVFAVCVYQLRYGIDVQDTSSYLTKFRYFFEKCTRRKLHGVKISTAYCLREDYVV